ncbi:MAG: ABC transporter permease [Clostridia bacterium]|nr:ABC transporter permease [Clostridia bacterium]
MTNRWQIVYRRFLERSFNILIPLGAILAAFLISSTLIIARGANPLTAYAALFAGAFGSTNALANTVTRMVPIIMTGLAVTYGYRSGFFNIGAEGQLFMGAMATTWMGITLVGWPAWLLIPASLLAGALAGSLWALIPGYLKARRGFNEVLTTLLLNYITIQLFEFLIRVDHAVGPGASFLSWIGLKDPSQPFPKSAYIAEAARMPSLTSLITWLGGTAEDPALQRFTLAAVIAVLAAVVIYILLFKTTTGYRARAVGVNPRAAQYMGINVMRTTITTALISGALAGMAGSLEIMGFQHRVIQNFLVGAGYDGIPVALIGQLNPLGVLLSALFFGALRAGANRMQIISGAPVSIIYVIQSLAILFAIAGTVIDLRPRRLKQVEIEEAKRVEAELAAESTSVPGADMLGEEVRHV